MTRYDTKSTGGKFQRSASAFRNWLTADGAPAPLAKAVLPQRKIVIISMFHSPCPWAHRTLIMRKLKGLEPFISVSVVNPLMLETAGPLMTVFREQPATRSINMNFCISFISTPIHTTADE